MDERVQEAVDIMLQYVQDHSGNGELEDILFFAYRYLVDAHQWRLQLSRQELDEAWEQVRDRVQNIVRESQQQ